MYLNEAILQAKGLPAKIIQNRLGHRDLTEHLWPRSLPPDGLNLESRWQGERTIAGNREFDNLFDRDGGIGPKMCGYVSPFPALGSYAMTETMSLGSILRSTRPDCPLKCLLAVSTTCSAVEPWMKPSLCRLSSVY